MYDSGSLTQMTKGADTLRFAYDSAGTPMTVTYNGAVYYYATNLQGDVIAILDTAGTIVVQYTYSAWGNPLTATGTMATTLGTLNPLRYRGYVYDEETGLYYLQSRYYDPEVGRFINVDKFASTGQDLLGHNMFAYCNNNPIILRDPNGELGILATMLIAAAVGVVTQYVCDVVANAWEGKKGVDVLKPRGTAGEYITSGLSGAICAIPGAGLAVSAACDVVAPAVEQGIDYLTYGDEWDWEEYGEDIMQNVAFDITASSLSIKEPTYIRDIKEDATKAGYKGTKQLTRFLKNEQIKAFLINQGINMGVTVTGSAAVEIIPVFD